MNIHLCKGDESLEDALIYVNQNDSEGRTFDFDKELDRCYIGDEKFVNAPVLINYKNIYWALHEVTQIDD